MRRPTRTLAAALAAGLVSSFVALSSPVAPADAGSAGEYVVTFDSDVDAVARARKERALGNAVTDVFSHAVDGIVAMLDAGDVRRLKNDPDVLAVEPNAAVRVADVRATAGAGRFIVRLRSDVSPLAMAWGVGATNVTTYRHAITGFAADLTNEARALLLKDPNVLAVEADSIVRATDTQESPESWGLDRIDQRELPLDSTYTYASAGSGVRAYVVDTGVRVTHTDFGGRVADGYDGVRDGNGTTDCNGHGTHVAGIIAGAAYGVAKSATVVPVRVLGCAGSGWVSQAIAGIDWIVNDHVDGQPAVANLSFSGVKSESLNAAVTAGVADGVTFVVAAGNKNVDACNVSPASEPMAITVGASTREDSRANFSNWGSCVDLFAPGDGITSATWTADDASSTLSGTSMASPHVAGTAALLLGQDPTLDPANVATLIASNATINRLASVGEGSPNRLLYTGGVEGPITTTPSPPSTVPAPSNDNFADALVLTSASGSRADSNVDATREASEPAHGGVGGLASLWYRWTAPADGDLVVATGSTTDASLTSDFDTLLGVYTGSVLSDLTPEATNDDFAVGSRQYWSQVALEVTKGTTYSIAVDGWAGRTGNIKLSWDFVPVDNSIVPSAPRSVSVTALDGSGYVNWLAPLTLGRGTVTYTATASPGGASCGTVGLRCLIGGLANGTTYTVTVTATNAAGTGPDSTPSASFTPETAANRPIQTRAWGLDRIDQRALPLNGVISRTATGRAVSVYVIDTGVFAAHNEFAMRVAPGRNTMETATDPSNTTDCNGHGTHVAATIAGSNFGVAPDATVIPVKVLDCNGGGSVAGVLAGIDWMIAHHEEGVPAVANMSLGGDISVAMNDAVAAAVADGITVVVAAGNAAKDACKSSPASAPIAVTVGATERSDARAFYSNYGRCVDIFAPGTGILSAGISAVDAEETLSGTSMASPHVAGAAALILEADPSSTPAAVARQLTDSATRSVVSDAGSGSPNLLLYIGRVEPDTTPTTLITPTTAPAPPASAESTSTQPASPSTEVPTSSTATPQSSTSPALSLGKIRGRATTVSASPRPTVRVVRVNTNRVVLRISVQSGAVDVLANGKFLLKTTKRVVVLRSKGIGKKRITVRASLKK